jgi:hypothetical protein
MLKPQRSTQLDLINFNPCRRLCAGGRPRAAGRAQGGGGPEAPERALPRLPAPGVPDHRGVDGLGAGAAPGAGRAAGDRFLLHASSFWQRRMLLSLATFSGSSCNPAVLPAPVQHSTLAIRSSSLLCNLSSELAANGPSQAATCHWHSNTCLTEPAAFPASAQPLTRPHGASHELMSRQVALPELDGALEPIIFAGRDSNTGKSHSLPVRLPKPSLSCLPS